MSITDVSTGVYSWSASGKIGRGRGFGSRKYGYARYGDNKPQAGVYQARMTRRGKVSVQMEYYRPKNPRTVAQQANRAKFADAMSAWQALTDSERASYTKRAKKRNMFGWGYFVREYYQSH